MLNVRHAALIALVVVVAALAVAAASMGGASAAVRWRAGVPLTGIPTSPSWSPDGKQIAFAYGQRGTGPYRIVRRSSRPGGGVRTVLAAPRAKWGCCSEMLWGPGSRILLDPVRGLVDGRLKIVGVLSGKSKGIVFSGTCRLSPCSPQSFILSPNREYAGVTTMDGGSAHSPDGIQLVQMKPGRDPVVLPTPFSGENSDWPIAFSPDSRQLVFWSCLNFDPYDSPPCLPGLMAARLPGGTPVPLAQSGIPGAALVPGDVQQLQWSPDSRWVAFVENQSLEVAPTAGTSGPRALATCPDGPPGFSWSPTSKLIAYYCSTQPNGSGQLMTVRPDGTHLTNLLAHRRLAYDGNERVPQWSPDGSRLLILASRVTGYDGVWTVRPNGHDLTRLG